MPAAYGLGISLRRLQAAVASGGKTASGGSATATRRAFDHIAQVNFFHDIAANQEGIGFFVSSRQALTQKRLYFVLNQRPDFARQTQINPFVDQSRRQGFRPQHIFFVQLRDILQRLHAHCQVVQLPSDLVEYAQRQARGQNFVFDRIVFNEREAYGAQSTRLGARVLGHIHPSLYDLFHPLHAQFRKSHPGIAAVLHIARAAGFVQQVAEVRVDLFTQERQHLFHAGHEELTRFGGQREVRLSDIRGLIHALKTLV